MRKQEEARLAELAAEKAHQEAIQAQLAIVSIILGQPSYAFVCFCLFYLGITLHNS